MGSPPLYAVLLALVCFTLAGLVWVLIRWRQQRREIEIQRSEISRCREQLAALRQEADEIDRQRKQLLSIVSHDLKGPFNRIFALAQLMAMGEPLSAQQAAYLQHIHRLVADGLSMVRNLADTRSLEGELSVHPEKISVTDAVRATVQQFQAVAEKKKIVLRWQPLSAGIFVVADRAMLARVLDNVLANAIKFSKEQKEIFISIRSETGWGGISIRDQGPGFTPNDEARLYRKFQKLTARPTGGETSTGLGLWIVKLLMDRMGGKIEFKTEPGLGTEFTLFLPESRVS